MIYTSKLNQEKKVLSDKYHLSFDGFNRFLHSNYHFKLYYHVWIFKKLIWTKGRL